MSKKKRDYGNLESVFGGIQKPSTPMKTTTTDGCKEGEKRFTTILSVELIKELKSFCKALGLPVKDVVSASLAKYLREKQDALEASKKALEEQRAAIEKLQNDLLQ